MPEQETRVVEINGVKVEVDLREAKTVERYRVGDLVKVLIKKYADQYISHAGVIIGFDDFKNRPTIVVAYLDVEFNESTITIGYIYEGADHEITHASPSDVPFSKEKVLEMLDKQIAGAQKKVDEVQWHKDQFIQWFGKMFEPAAANVST